MSSATVTAAAVDDLFGAPAGPADCQKAQPERVLPDAWVKLLGSIPKAYREPVIRAAWRLHDDVLAKALASDRPDRMPKQLIERVMAQTTAAALISSAIFVPYHLVPKEQKDKAIELIEQDVYELSKWLRRLHPEADRLLVVGDQPQAEQLAAVLDDQLASHPARYLCIGPGKDMEQAVRAYADARGIPENYQCSVDAQARGDNWAQVPGMRLDKLIERVFREMKPDRVIALEPVRMPATIALLAEARKRQLPVLHIDGSAADALPAKRMRLAT